MKQDPQETLSEQSGIRAAEVFAPRQRHKDCAVWFQAIRGDGRGRPTAQLENIIQSMRIARLLSPTLQFIFFYTRLYGAHVDMTTLRNLRKNMAPLETIYVGSPSDWARELNFDKSFEPALQDVLSMYPYPLKSIALHKTAQQCEMAVYFDADVLLFRDARELLQMLEQSPTVSMLAPPEVNTYQWCRLYAAQHQRWTCEAGGIVSVGALSKLIAKQCLEKGMHEHLVDAQIFQSSVMVLGREVLKLWSERQFVVDYLVLVIRVLDGSRNPNARLQGVPPTHKPIRFPAPAGKDPHWFIAEQIAYYLVLACNDIKVGLLDRKVVLTGIFMESDHFSDIGNCSLSVVAWHTQAGQYVDALQWYIHRHQRCTSVEEFVR